MSKKNKLTGEQEVDLFIEKTDHPQKQEITALRNIILNSDPEITEHIKWNAPSFCVNGEDRFTFKLNSPKNS